MTAPWSKGSGGAEGGSLDVAVKPRPGGAAAPTLDKGLWSKTEGLPSGERQGEREGAAP